MANLWWETNPDKTKRRNTRNLLISNYFNNVSSTRGNSERFQRRNPVTHRKKGRARQPNNAVRAGLNKWLITLIIRVRESAAAPRSGQRKYWASGVGAAFSYPVHRWRISCKCRDYKTHRRIKVKLGASVDNMFFHELPNLINKRFVLVLCRNRCNVLMVKILSHYVWVPRPSEFSATIFQTTDIGIIKVYIT